MLLVKQLTHWSTISVVLLPQAIDFPAWLGNNTTPGDSVIVHMDLGEGREFEMLESLLLSDRLTLIDHLFVQWHYQAEVKSNSLLSSCDMSIMICTAVLLLAFSFSCVCGMALPSISDTRLPVLTELASGAAMGVSAVRAGHTHHSSIENR